MGWTTVQPTAASPLTARSKLHAVTSKSQQARGQKADGVHQQTPPHHPREVPKDGRWQRTL